MAIAVKLDDLLHDRRMTLTELAERIDITLANLSILKTGKARAIRFSTLEAICAVLKWSAGQMPATFTEDFQNIAFGVILMPIVIPWGYVYRHYVKQPGARWR